MCETGTGQQVAQLLDCYMMTVMTMIIVYSENHTEPINTKHSFIDC